MKKNIYFFFPHQDDEIGVINIISEYCKLNYNVFCIYLTSSPTISNQRNYESKKFLTHLGVKKNNINFLGTKLGILDGNLVNKLNESYAAIKKNILTKKNSFDEVYTPSYEGGNPDHDASFIILYKLINKYKKLSNFYQFPLYNSKKCVNFFYNVMYPIQKKNIIYKRSVSKELILTVLIIPTFFKTQKQAMLGLYPFIIYKYILRGYIEIENIKSFKLDKPHKGKLYYETRKWCKWGYFFNKANKFLMNN